MDETMGVRNANIVTLDPALPRAEEMLIENGVITRLGPRGTLSGVGAAGAHCLDMQGKTVLPGFIDSHLHMLTAGLTKLQADLGGQAPMAIPQLMAHLGAQAPDGDGWVRAFGFDEERVLEKRMLTAKDIDAAFPRRPVIITRVCGHVSILNTTAMRAAGINNSTADMDGGAFLRDEAGAPTGVVTERAQQVVLDRIPPHASEVNQRMLAAEQQHLLENGICSIHDAGTDLIAPRDYVREYIDFNASGKLKLRTYLMVRPFADESYAAFEDYLNALKKEYDPRRDRLFFGAVKLFADGSIGGRTAAVYDGYEGDAANRGLLLKEMLDEYVVRCHQSGFQLIVHAIGERAIEYTADRMRQGLMAAPRANHRHRIEHCELCSEHIIDKIVESGLAASVQPAFISQFGANYQRNLSPRRAARILPLKTLLGRGVPLGFSTDYPVIRPSPFAGMDAAMRRVMAENGQPLNKDECIGLMQALHCYTAGSAYGSFTEHLQGTLAPGKFGDFVTVDRSLDEMGKGGLSECRVLQTVVGGQLLYERP